MTKPPWFPVFDEQLDTPEFQQLTASEKVFYWYLASEYNKAGGPFYRADVEWAAALGLSEIKVRKARKKFERLGWVKIVPGSSPNGKKLATKYLSVRWAIPGDRKEGTAFSQMHKYGLDVMMGFLPERGKRFSHQDVAVYVYICHLWGTRGALGGRYWTSKRQFRESTGFPKADQSVKALYEGLKFQGGNRLFEYEDQYHALVFTRLGGFADPVEDEGVQKKAKALENDIRRRATELREAKDMATRSRLETLPAR